MGSAELVMSLVTGRYSGLPGQRCIIQGIALNYSSKTGKVLTQKHTWTPGFQKGPEHRNNNGRPPQTVLSLMPCGPHTALWVGSFCLLGGSG